MKIKKQAKKTTEAVVEGVATSPDKIQVAAIKDTEDIESPAGAGLVGIKLGVTQNGPMAYSSIRADVSIEVPLGHSDDASEAYAAAKSWAEARLQEALQELYSALE